MAGDLLINLNHFEYNATTLDARYGAAEPMEVLGPHLFEIWIDKIYQTSSSDVATVPVDRCPAVQERARRLARRGTCQDR